MKRLKLSRGFHRKVAKCLKFIVGLSLTAKFGGNSSIEAQTRGGVFSISRRYTPCPEKGVIIFRVSWSILITFILLQIGVNTLQSTVIYTYLMA